jgi:predicted nucleic acid-binding protein
MAINPSFVLDTNIALYHLGGQLQYSLPTGQYFVSIITKMELLSYPSLAPAEEQQIRRFLAQLQILNLTESIKQIAIDLRKQNRPKLPDSIIAATACDLNATLLTNDLKLAQIPLLSVQSLPLRSRL